MSKMKSERLAVTQFASKMILIFGLTAVTHKAKLNPWL